MGDVVLAGGAAGGSDPQATARTANIEQTVVFIISSRNISARSLARLPFGTVSLQFDRIQKSFGAITALRGVSFDVAEGEAHALVGENGAGKSTLLKILAGLVRPDAGELRWQGRAFAPASPREAIDHGIGMVYQEMLCLPNLSVSANIFCGREICRGGRLDEPAMRARTRAVLDRLSLGIDPDALAETLSAAHRQLLQVARALTFDCRILVLDEPTTALTDAEADHLFDVLRELQRGGTTILYVSHRLPEVFRLCDRITVLRDGAYVGTYPRSDVSANDIVKAMVGRELPARHDTSGAVHHADAHRAHTDALVVTGLSVATKSHDVSLAVAPGEIVGLFGLVGSGRSELLETLIGLHRPSSGTIAVAGTPVTFHSPRDAARAGVVLVPEERHRQGLLFNLDLRHNLVIPKRELDGNVLVQTSAETRDAAHLLGEWRIKAPGIDAFADMLSGGNQQKVVVAKWLATKPRVLLLDEPTKGVDVGAKFEIHELIRKQAAEGLAVLVVSSDLPEVLALADRVLVMKEGRLQGEIPGGAATEEAVMHLATHPSTHRLATPVDSLRTSDRT
jgi:rhamnose transport system ATP-binding protein